MGSAASSSVKDIQGEFSDGEMTVGHNASRGENSFKRPAKPFRHKSDTKVAPSNSEVTEMKAELEKYKELLAAAKERAICAEEKAKNADSLMAELDSEKLELMDNLAIVEQQLQSLQCTPKVDDWSNTLQAKEQYIEYLEGQVEKSKIQVNTLKKKYQKKLRILNRRLSEVKQSQSVMSLEHHQEKMSLTEEIKLLKDQLRKLPKENCTIESNIVDSRTEIILELSSRVSEQDSKISDLEKSVEEKDIKIRELEAKVNELQGSSINKTKHVFSHEAGNNSFRSKTEVDDYQHSWNYTEADQQEEKWNNNGRNDYGEVNHRESSGVSRDSGIATIAKKMAGEGSRKSDDSDWCDSDTDDYLEDKETNESSNHCQNSITDEATSCNGNPHVDSQRGHVMKLDPSSIRQISAAKLRQQRRLHKKPVSRKETSGFDIQLNHVLTDSDNIRIRTSNLLQVT